jgi:hypothetical protein
MFSPEQAEMERWLHSYQRDEHSECQIEVLDSIILYRHYCGLQTIPYPVSREVPDV